MYHMACATATNLTDWLAALDAKVAKRPQSISARCVEAGFDRTLSDVH
jgi:hypothetical protein